MKRFDVVSRLDTSGATPARLYDVIDRLSGAVVWTGYTADLATVEAARLSRAAFKAAKDHWPMAGGAR